MKSSVQLLVSVLIPTYNGEEYVKKTIESVLNQSLTNFELIICDDASTDRTSEILEDFAYSDSRISVYRFDDNVGLPGNWNRCLKRANGTYIKILCHDDLIRANYLKETVEIMESNRSLSLICSFQETVGEIKMIRSHEDFQGSGEIKGDIAQDRILSKGNWIGAPSATLFRREDLQKTGLFDEHLACSLDWEMWLRLLGLGNLYVIPKILYSTRIHRKQESSNCINNLGFLKDKISVLQKIQHQPSLYGRKRWDVRKKIYKNSVYKLLSAAMKQQTTTFSDAMKFLQRYHTLPVVWMFVISVIFRRFVKIIRSTNSLVL
jgi:glycosyltransferase involved in cell wall biosynthesis